MPQTAPRVVKRFQNSENMIVGRFADAATAKADAEIAAKAAESEKTIAGIRDGAAAAVAEVAKDVAAALVGALGGGADAKTITTAVTARLKG